MTLLHSYIDDIVSGSVIILLWAWRNERTVYCTLCIPAPYVWSRTAIPAMQVSVPRKPHLSPATADGPIMGSHGPTLSWQLLATWSHSHWSPGHNSGHWAANPAPSPASPSMICAHLGTIYWAGLFLWQSRVGCLHRLSIFVHGSEPGGAGASEAQEVETAWWSGLWCGPCVYLCAGRAPHTRQPLLSCSCPVPGITVWLPSHMVLTCW